MTDTTKRQVLVLDFETYYDTAYSLSRMTPAEYILDPRFETIMCSVRRLGSGQPAFVVDGPDFPDWIKSQPPELTVTVTFNSLFDNAILAWRYGWIPYRMLDAMGMARAVYGHLLPRASLAVVAETLGIGKKGDTVHNVRGMRRSQIIAAGLWPSYSTYCCGDTDLTTGVLAKCLPFFPESEQRLMDMVLRACIEPGFHADTDMLEQHIADLETERAELLNAAGVDESALGSSVKFAELLRSVGIEPGLKPSPSNPMKDTYAFAKTDHFMQELLEHPDTRVQALAAGRLGVKSTIEQTRAQKFMRIANLPWPDYLGGKMLPMPLRYGAAHTHRLGGDWKMNPQNLPTSRGSKGKSKLRRALIAPPGHKVLTIDLGQIEARLGAWFCGATTLLEQFANKLDPYAKLGSAIFGFEVDRKVHIIEGFIGKTGILGLGYGCGVDKFHTMVTTMAKGMGLDLTGKFDELIAAEAVHTYRRVHHPIPRMWGLLDQHLKTAWLGRSGPVKVGPVVIGNESNDGSGGQNVGYVLLPNGLKLQYANPHKTGTGELYYEYGGMRHHIYGAKLLENIIQALARIVVMNAALRIYGRGRKQPCFRFKLQAHDELVYILPDSEIEQKDGKPFHSMIHEEMTRSPSWAKELPLTADVGVGQTYGDAK